MSADLKPCLIPVSKGWRHGVFGWVFEVVVRVVPGSVSSLGTVHDVLVLSTQALGLGWISGVGELDNGCWSAGAHAGGLQGGA